MCPVSFLHLRSFSCSSPNCSSIFSHHCRLNNQRIDQWFQVTAAWGLHRSGIPQITLGRVGGLGSSLQPACRVSSQSSYSRPCLAIDQSVIDHSSMKKNLLIRHWGQPLQSSPDLCQATHIKNSPGPGEMTPQHLPLSLMDLSLALSPINGGRGLTDFRRFFSWTSMNTPRHTHKCSPPPSPPPIKISK